MNSYTGKVILLIILCSSVNAFSQDSDKKTLPYGKYLNLSVGVAGSRLFGSMIERQTERNDQTHKGAAGLYLGFSIQTDFQKNIFTDIGLEFVIKQSEYEIPSHFFPAKAKTTFVGIPIGIGYRVGNDPGTTFQILVGAKLNLAVKSEDNLERGVRDPTFYDPLYTNLVVSYFATPQFRIRLNDISVILLSYRIERDLSAYFRYYDNVVNETFEAKFNSHLFTIGVMSRITTWNKNL